jgi:hypothetical protein
MEDMRPKLTVRDIFGYLMSYLCWLCTAAVGMLAVLQTRNALNVIWPVLGGSHWVLRPVDRFGLVFLGLLWLMYVIFVEQHYRLSVTLVREKRFRVRTDPTAKPSQPPSGRFMKLLYRMGLDVLALRFALTLMVPLVWFMVTYLIQQLGFQLIAG